MRALLASWPCSQAEFSLLYSVLLEKRQPGNEASALLAKLARAIAGCTATVGTYVRTAFRRLTYCTRLWGKKSDITSHVHAQEVLGVGKVLAS